MKSTLFDWKVCKTCGEELPTTEFSLAHAKYAQYRGSCKRCERSKLKNTEAYDLCECGKTKKRESSLCVTCWNRNNAYHPSFKKVCSGCSVEKLASEFGWRMHKDVKRIRTLCKSCGRKRAADWRSKLSPEELRLIKRKAAKRSASKAIADPAYRLNRRRQAIRRSCRTLGLAELQEEIAAIYELDTKCAICGVVPHGRLHIDHCHSTGKFRGFLCNSCNTGLGQFRDNVQFLKNAIAYLSGESGLCG